MSSGSIAVAIDKDKNSQSALKWAIDHLGLKGKHVTLLHVHPRTSAVLTYSGTNMPYVANEGVAKAVKSEAESQIKELLLPFRVFCTRKNMQVNEVVVEDSDVVKALCNYVKDNAIENLVLGATQKVGLARKFMSTDISGNVSKLAPDFCNVYVINKGKLFTVRSASTPLCPIPRSKSSPMLGDLISEASGQRDRSTISSESEPDEMHIIKSPFTRYKNMNNYNNDISPSNSEISVGTPHRRSQELSFEQDKQSSNGSVFSSGRLPPDANNSFGQFSSEASNSSGALSSSSYGSNKSASPQKTDDLEADIRRLQNELKQKMEMYNNACNEAIASKHKASEIDQWSTDKQQRVGKARLGEGTALEIAERERAKCKAAIEAAGAAQRIAELETHKRKKAETKANKETAEKKKMACNEARYRKYTIEEIKAATDNFSNSRKIGEGGYGPVFKCNLDHTPVAIKVLRPDAVQGESQFRQEIEVLCCIRHPNLVLLLGACPDYGCLVYEYMANGSLEDCIFNQGKKRVLPWQFRFRIAAEIASALLFLHQTKPEPLVHRDLKPGNILLDRHYVSKISDVGLARLVPASVADTTTQYHMTSAAGTFCYIDPEYQQTGMLGTKSDVYSLGVMLLQIITARPPMALTHHVDKAIQRGTFAETLDPAVPDWPVEEAMNFAKLALKCTELRKKDRPDLAHEILPELNRLRNFADQSVPNMFYA